MDMETRLWVGSRVELRWWGCGIDISVILIASTEMKTI